VQVSTVDKCNICCILGNWHVVLGNLNGLAGSRWTMNSTSFPHQIFVVFREKACMPICMHEQGLRGTEWGERERKVSSRLCTECGTPHWVGSQDPEIMT